MDNIKQLLSSSEWTRRNRKDNRKRITRYRNWRNGVIMIDGEGKTDANGQHHYTLLADSNENCIESEHLSTIECLEFLLNLPQNQLIVMYSFNYDVTKWLSDLPFYRLKYLHQTTHVRWKHYSITYVPSREFIVKDGTRSCHVYDIFPFFQCPFAKALTDWKIGNCEEQQHIERMKAERRNFDQLSDNEIKRYCFLECKLGVQLAQELIDCLVSEDLEVSRWYGPGPIAQKLLDKNHVYESLAWPNNPELEDAIMRAYFGGRTEIVGAGYIKIGKDPSYPVHSYDINSAYPAACIALPCLRCSTWKEINDYVLGMEGVWLVEWKIKDYKDGRGIGSKNLWPPFPVRANHRISYPMNGIGWYWHHEVEAALEAFGPGKISVKRGYILQRGCDHKPFSFIEDIYKQRLKYKRVGDLRHIALKLGINAVYGKLAQTVGRDHHKRPRYQNFILAGMITSHCRARILKAIHSAWRGTRIKFVATDGFLSTQELDLPLSEELGGWEHHIYHNAFIVQPGIYTTSENRRVRGFWNRSISFTDLEDIFNNNYIGTFHYNSTSFIGISTAVASEEYRFHIGNWLNVERRVTFCPQTRLLEPIGLIGLRLLAEKKPHTKLVFVYHYPPPQNGHLQISEPYKPYKSRQEKVSNGLEPTYETYIEQP